MVQSFTGHRTRHVASAQGSVLQGMVSTGASPRPAAAHSSSDVALRLAPLLMLATSHQTCKIVLGK